MHSCCTQPRSGYDCAARGAHRDCSRRSPRGCPRWLRGSGYCCSSPPQPYRSRQGSWSFVFAPRGASPDIESMSAVANRLPHVLYCFALRTALLPGRNSTFWGRRFLDFRRRLFTLDAIFLLFICLAHRALWMNPIAGIADFATDGAAIMIARRVERRRLLFVHRQNFFGVSESLLRRLRQFALS